MRKDKQTILQIEDAIKKKYGEKAVSSPKENWDEIKEQQYLDEVKRLDEKMSKRGAGTISSQEKLFTKEETKVCEVCNEYSFNKRDDVYLTKFFCCRKCYIQHIEGREEKWPEKRLLLPKK